MESTYSTEDKLTALDLAISTYSAAGYTGVVDMAMDEATWEILNTYRKDKGFPFHIAAHWLVPFSNDQHANLAYVDRAIELRQRTLGNPRFCILGIKLICDGVVDGCTAALFQPYPGKSDAEDTIWPTEALKDVVQRADAAELQCAIHAIGDKT
ncbi:uncharacterized protein BDW70DRAFT_164500 [Aspergillus foveolatus]|uniref:uncharacterized protein n=1 Tax=Aspergillus foveolatus TaxID=210207 RepID=UPI003CCDD1FF